MAEYKHGSMDITTQEKTFNGFITFTTRAIIVILALVIFMALANA
jgi:hypothetical protein